MNRGRRSHSGKRGLEIPTPGAILAQEASVLSPANRESTMIVDRRDAGPPPFKICPKCGHPWPTRSAFLSDPQLEIIGYQAYFPKPELGILLFNHRCRGTLAVKAGAFSDLYDGPVFQQRLTGSEHCPGYCLHERELSPCPAACECAYIREIIRMIKTGGCSGGLADHG